VTLENRQQVENTHEKLRLLQERYRANAEAPGEMTYARRLTMRSLKRLINELTEEIVRYESRIASSATGASSRAEMRGDVRGE
jgi:hypothetical protein